MLATTTDVAPDDDLENHALVYEPKYDGIRALVALEPAQPSPRVQIWSRLGNEKTSQFPEIADALGIAPKTASSHVEHILAKLGAARRAEIATWAGNVERSTGSTNTSTLASSPRPWPHGRPTDGFSFDAGDGRPATCPRRRPRCPVPRAGVG